MKREYIPKINNPYYLGDRDIHMQMVYMLRNYPKLKSVPGGAPSPSEVIIKAIEQTLDVMNEKYKRTYTGEPFDAYKAFMDYAVFCYYRSKPGKDEAPSEKTWKRYRAEVTYTLAQKMNYIKK